MHAGWSMRRESRHFPSYEEVAKHFGKFLGIDHWLIHPLFAKVEGLDLPRTRVWRPWPPKWMRC